MLCRGVCLRVILCVLTCACGYVCCVLAAAGIAVADTKAMGGMGGNTLQTRTVGLQADIGTPIYMSPEQLKKGAVAGNQSDLWSTGTTPTYPFQHITMLLHTTIAIIVS